jgi:hypothetical protein
MLKILYLYFSILTNQLLEQSPSLEANRSSVRQTSCILWKPRDHYHIHNHLPPVSVPSQSKTIHACPTHKIHCNIILLSMPGSSKWFLSIRFPHQNLVCTSLVPHTCHVLHPSYSLLDHPNNIW